MPQYSSTLLWQGLCSFARLCRAVGMSQNTGGGVVIGGYNLAHLVRIGVTDLPKYGRGDRPPALPVTTALL